MKKKLKTPKDEIRYQEKETLLEKAKRVYSESKKEMELKERTAREMKKAKAYNWVKEHLVESILSNARQGSGSAGTSSDTHILDMEQVERLKQEPKLTGLRIECYMEDDRQVVTASGWAE